MKVATVLTPQRIMHKWLKVGTGDLQDFFIFKIKLFAIKVYLKYIKCTE